MIVNNTILYALLGLIYLSKNPRRSVKISEIAQAEKISVSFLQKVFQVLSRGKIVKATFGPNGGFVLARPAKKITLHQIIKIMKPEENRMAKTFMCEVCRHRDGRLLLHFMMHLRDDFLQYAKSLTLADLVNHKD
ncbi:MAG: Rrf2 family transcriptional regulator [Patescibacteria group bacterium]